MAAPKIDELLTLCADRPDSVLASLRQHPELASQQDDNGYSLFHAAASYGHIAVMRELVREYGVTVNIKDEDGMTALFHAETLAVAKCLVEDLEINTAILMNDGRDAAEYLEAEAEFPDVADYLLKLPGRGHHENPGMPVPPERDAQQFEAARAPPPLPPGIQLNMGTMQELPQLEDSEFRQRIEQLAASGDFQGDQGQARLRELIADVVREASSETHGDTRQGSRRRLG